MTVEKCLKMKDRILTNACALGRMQKRLKGYLNNSEEGVIDQIKDDLLYMCDVIQKTVDQIDIPIFDVDNDVD